MNKFKILSGIFCFGIIFCCSINSVGAAENRVEISEKNYSRLFGAEEFEEFKNDPELAATMKKFIYGDLYTQINLPDRERQLVTIVVLAAHQNKNFLEKNVEAALKIGVTPLEIRESIYQLAERSACGNYLKSSVDFSKGIRILRQEPFETLVSFIISQRKTIPAIRKSVELICEQFGRIIKTDFEDSIHLFPTPEQLSKATMLHLSNCALGYRGAYVRDAIEKVVERIVRLDGFRKTPDGDMLAELQQIKGVGIKIASCVALYAYHRLNIAPIDVWIKRAIQDDFKGVNIFAEFERHAGVLQQYIFYYKRLGEKEFDMEG